MIWLYSDPFDYSDLKWPDEENEMFSIEQRNQYDLVDGGKFFLGKKFGGFGERVETIFH